MKAVILVGGEGTRLRPLTFSVPKAMVPIVNKPFLAHMLEYLSSHGVDDVILAMGYLPDPIRDHFGDGGSLGVRMTYVIEDSPLGTAGAVKNVEGYIDDAFYVFNGDTFTDIDLTQMLKLHRDRKAMATIALTPVEDPTIYGVVETDAAGRVMRFVEKPSRDEVTTHMVNAGAYILEPEVLGLVPRGEKFMFEHGVFPGLLARGDAIYGYESDAYWIDIGTPQKYLRANHDLLAGEVNGRFSGEQVDSRIWLEAGCEIHPRAKLEGPVAVGEGCVIESGARVKGPSVVGAFCNIEANSLVEGSVIWHNTRLGEEASLRGSVVAENVTIGDKTEIGDGCILGHNVSVGGGARLTPGTEVWPEGNHSLN